MKGQPPSQGTRDGARRRWSARPPRDGTVAPWRYENSKPPVVELLSFRWSHVDAWPLHGWAFESIHLMGVPCAREGWPTPPKRCLSHEAAGPTVLSWRPAHRPESFLAQSKSMLAATWLSRLEKAPAPGCCCQNPSWAWVSSLESRGPCFYLGRVGVDLQTLPDLAEHRDISAGPLIYPASYKPRTRDPVKILWGSGVPSFAEAALPAPKALPGVPIAAPDLGTVQLARLGMKLSGVRTKQGLDRTGIGLEPNCESQKCLCIER